MLFCFCAMRKQLSVQLVHSLSHLAHVPSCVSKPRGYHCQSHLTCDRVIGMYTGEVYKFFFFFNGWSVCSKCRLRIKHIFGRHLILFLTNSCEQTARLFKTRQNETLTYLFVHERIEQFYTNISTLVWTNTRKPNIMEIE